ncbi:MAG TPA: sigma-70 region 4 domain-containing protein [Ktedonobacterales bacterium]|nr:sigma-70 region 4 domain-containing protein [Ktedonobacterales bacterium]
MSTATTTSPNINITHLPHTPHIAHPIPLREQAFTLHCHGLRSPAIAAELGVSERTIRAWIAAALADLKDDLQLNRKQQILLAVERQNQLTATAWQQFDHEAAARDALLDATLNTLLDAGAQTSDAPAHPITVHLPASTPAPRYLSLILQANKEANRLLGLHTLARLQLLSPDTAPADSPNAAESATAAEPGLAAGLQLANPHHATPSPSLEAATETDIPAESATDIPAESATAASSSLLVGEGFPPVAGNGEVPVAPGSSLLVGERLGVRSQPAHRTSTRRLHPWMM